MSGPLGDEINIDLLRAATPAERFALTCELSAVTIEWARRIIAKQYPELDSIGRDVKFVELHYGAELAARIEPFLRERELARARKEAGLE